MRMKAGDKMAARNIVRELGLLFGAAVLALLALGGAAWYYGACPAGSGHVQDEARLLGRNAVTFPHVLKDYFHDMDNGVALTEDEVRGNDMWIVWTGGNDRFWDKMITASLGVVDLLKIVTSDSTQSIKGSRTIRTRDGIDLAP